MEQYLAFAEQNIEQLLHAGRFHMDNPPEEAIRLQETFEKLKQCVSDQTSTSLFEPEPQYPEVIEFLRKRGVLATENEDEYKQSASNSAENDNTDENKDVKEKEDLETAFQEASDDQLKPLSASEFGSVPKYMKGRMNIGTVNAVVAKINLVLQEKYQLLSQPFGRLRKMDKNLVLAFKDEECPETQGRKFCTEAQLKQRLQKDKNSKEASQLRQIIPILRHCHRIQEVRVGKILRYVVI